MSGSVRGTAAPPSSEIDVGKLIAGGFAVVAGAITLVGGYTGAVARILRNDDTFFIWALGLALLAVGVSLFTSQPWAKQAWKSVRVGGLIAAFALFAASGWFMIEALKESLTEIDQPKIAVTWKDPVAGAQPVATVKIGIDGVQTDNTLFVVVHPGEKLTENDVQGVVTSYVLYHARVGANLDGVADMTFDVQVPQGYGSIQIIASLDQIRDCAGRVAPGSPSTPTGETPPASENQGTSGEPTGSTAAGETASPTGSGLATMTESSATTPAQVTTTALQPTDAGVEPNFSCVVAMAPIDGTIPTPSNALTPMSTSVVTVTTTAALSSASP